MNASPTEALTHVVTGAGPANGFTITGKRKAAGTPHATDVPLIIAIHGGTYTSTYFDIPGYSLLDNAGDLGIPIIAIDRPGYLGSTKVPDSDSIILKNAEILDQVIGELWEAYGAGTAGVFIIGHSIGGAVTTAIAAGHPSWPLLGIALSGCLLHVNPADREAFNGLPPIEYVDLPSPMKDTLMFGPEGSYAAGMPDASHPSDAPVPRLELLDINNGWVGRVLEVNAEVTVPVFARQAEFDRLWITNAEEVADFAASFTGSPLVDVRLLGGSGHCIDFHRGSAAFQLEELGFALEVASQRASA